MKTSKLTLILGASAMAAVMLLGASAARAQATSQDVNVVNVVDTNVVNIPDVKIANEPTVNNVPGEDSAPFIATIDSVPLNQSFLTDVTFSNLVTKPTDRLIIDYVSVEGVAAPFQQLWASILPCTEKNNWGRIAVPLQFNGPVIIGGNRVNDAFSGNVAMRVYVDQGCTATVRVFRSPTAGNGHLHVTLQGHRVSKAPIIIRPQ